MSKPKTDQQRQAGDESEPRRDSRPSDDLTDLSGEDAAALIERLTTERDEAIEGRKRTLADFVNYQRRANEMELRARDGGVAFVARSMMPALDQMDLALAQGQANITVEGLMQAVGMLRTEFNKALERSGIERIEPRPGDPFDPHIHEAVMKQAVDGVAPGDVASCLQTGYRLGEMTLRPAKVSVAPE